MVKKISEQLVKFLVIVLLGWFMFGWTGQPAGAAALQADIPEEVLLENGYLIIFNGVEYHADGTSTWHYTVEELPSAQDLSNWVLETPFCAPIVGADPEPWEIVDPDPNAQLSGIKWETGGGFQQGQFEVTLETTGQVGITNVAAKGPDLAFGQIAGPTCIEEEPPEEEPPVEPGDDEPPTIEWVEPVSQGEVFELQEGETVELVVNATDNVAVDRVTFLRWDAVNGEYVTIAVDEEAPYQVTVSASELNPTWNQIFAASFDTEDNQSEWEWIWLYTVVSGPLFEAPDTIIFLPLIQ